MKNEKTITRATYLLASILGCSFLLYGCGGSDDAAQAIADEFVTVSGTISNLNGTGEADVNVEGVYTSPDGLLNPSTTTDSSGNFSLSVLKGDLVYLRATKDTFAIINSQKGALDANVSRLEIDIPTEVEAESAINTAFSGSPTLPVLQNHAWLVVDIEYPNGAQVGGQSVTSTRPPTGVYTACDESDSGGNATVACPPDKDAPMYIAYFDATGDSNIKVGTETQTAPLRLGEIAALEFTVTTAGQVKYDTACASCHSAGSYDTVSESASGLYGDGNLIITNLSSIKGMSSVTDITTQEVLDLQAFLGSISP
jgi:hypothetical protein